MATTTFSGPIKAGSIRQGASANLGFVKMSQSAAFIQSTTAASTGIIIPANSQITEITIYITTACDGASQNLSVGTTTGSNELFSALALCNLVQLELLQMQILGLISEQVMYQFMLICLLVQLVEVLLL